MPGLAAQQSETRKPHLSRSTGWLHSALKALRQRVLLQRRTVYVAQRAELAAALVRACMQGADLYDARPPWAAEAADGQVRHSA